VLQGGGAGPFLGQAGGNLGLLEVGRSKRVDEIASSSSRLVLSGVAVGRRWRSARHRAAWQEGRRAVAARQGAGALGERKLRNPRWNPDS
jgi:hypothetical protein